MGTELLAAIHKTPPSSLPYINTVKAHTHLLYLSLKKGMLVKHPTLYRAKKNVIAKSFWLATSALKLMDYNILIHELIRPG